MNITIPVNANHIARGQKLNCNKCPIALAVAEKMGVEHAFVNSEGITFRVGGREHDAYMCDDLMNVMDAFDAGVPLSPFFFDLVEHDGEYVTATNVRPQECEAA